MVDYKSGKPKPWTGRIETQIIQGRFLQLPIYLALAKAASATLRPVRETDEEAAEKTLTAEFWKSPSAPMFIENMKELIGIIEKERFYIEPDTGDWGYCSRCDFSRICRKEHMPSRIRAERDPLRQRQAQPGGTEMSGLASPRLAGPSPKGDPLPLEGRRRQGEA